MTSSITDTPEAENASQPLSDADPQDASAPTAAQSPSDKSSADQSPADQSPADQSYGEWTKLSPLSIIHFTLVPIYKFLTQGLQGLLPLFAVILTAGDKRWLILGIIGLVGSVLLLIFAVLSYLRFRFRLEGDQVHIEKGVLNRKVLHLDFDRIQSVDFQEPLYFRPFNLIVLKLDSAGSMTEEVKLGGIKRALADDLRKVILARTAAKAASATVPIAQKEQQTKTAEELAEETAAAAKPLLSLSTDELIRYGLSNNNIWVVTGIVGGFLPQLQPWEWGVFQAIGDFGDQNFGHLVYGLQIFVALICLLLFFLLITASVIGAIVSQYNFKLSYNQDGRFHRSKGLFERVETSVPDNKIQSVMFKRSWMAHLVNRWHIYIKQVSFGYAQAQQQARGGDSLLIPSAKDDFVTQLQSIIYPDFKLSDQFNPIAKRYMIKRLLYIFLPIGLLLSIPFFLNSAIGYYGLLWWALPVVCAPMVYLRWLRYGVQLHDNHGVIRSGFLGKKYTVFPLFKVQKVSVVQSYGQRKSGHATLNISLAGTRLSVPYMDLKDAEEWRDRILYKVETSSKNFM